MLRVPVQARPDVRRPHHRVLVVLTVVVAQLFVWLALVPSTSAASVPQTIDLRVLLIDDDSPWTDALQNQMTVEGVPFTDIPMASATRPTLTAAFLASGNHAFFQSVILPSYLGGGLTDAELAALRSFEATFGVREVDAFNYANPAVGLNVATVSGDLAPITATVTPAGLANGFQYLNGPVPFTAGSFSYLAVPLSATSDPPIPSGAMFTTLLSAPVPGSPTPGSLIGLYTSAAGVEQMIITSAMNFNQSHFKLVAHGILTWATRGIHLGYDRNRLTFHVDDAFSEDALWDPDHNCTPGEDCPRNPDGTSIYPESSVRMTADDVAFAQQWEAAHNYTFTLAFNGFSASSTDPLTQALVANKNSFKWLNHGFEHIFQGCVQDFTVTPWRCTTDATGNIVWVSQADIANEVNNNIAVATTFGLPINPKEYLSGEHSGLFLVPQQPVDNPNFVAAVSQAGLTSIGADASREPAPRQVGTATTVPRHPTILYYNATTVAQEVDEFNWLYTSRANGGSGYCEDNPTVATCVAPLDASGFASTIVPNDAAFDLSFILSNDPRPFYAHVSNMAGDRILYPLAESILNSYRTAFNANAPLLNLTMTDISKTFAQQSAWAASGMTAAPTVTASVTSGKITILNSGTSQVPLTAPPGTLVNGSTLESYGGELSGWLPAAASTTATVPGGPVLTVGSPNFAVGLPGTFTISAAGQPAPNIFVIGALPAGLSFNPGTGNASISGTPTVAGDYPVSVTAVNGAGRDTVAATLRVGNRPTFTSAASASAVAGSAFTFTVAASGSPTPALTVAGALPAGVAFRDNHNGTGTLAGTPASAGTAALTFSAVNTSGSTTQPFTLSITAGGTTGGLRFISAATATATATRLFNFQAEVVGTPTPTITRTGTLPAGVTFTAKSNGTALISGTPTASSGGTYPLTLTARNSTGSIQQSFVLTVGQRPAFTSPASFTAARSSTVDFVVRTTGFPAAKLTKTGTLPSGLTFTAASDGTARIAGKPTTRGTFRLTITATNASGTSTQDLTIRIT
jgi:Putative Ig domain